ncbi:MAG: SIS domain-containing protein [Pseudomonadota bacterium]
MDQKQGEYALISEMLESLQVIENFRVDVAKEVFADVRNAYRIFFTGEGSSRIFPAHHVISLALEWGLPHQFHSEGCYQSMEVKLRDWVVFAASNSGKTKELILLLQKLQQHKQSFIGITNGKDSPLHQMADKVFLLSCGKEKAIAATKSVIEQALFYHTFLCELAGKDIRPRLPVLKTMAEKVLREKISDEIVEMAAQAPRIYFSGRNNGVAEELTLKTIEITRKSAVYLEGTFAFHGIEEVMQKDEVIVIIDPFSREEENFDRILQKGVGIKVVAISSRPTRFPTILIPEGEEFRAYLQLMAGWNLLIHIGLKLGINIDKPKRARKVGNEI